MKESKFTYVYGNLGTTLLCLGLCRSDDKSRLDATFNAYADGYTHCFTSSVWHRYADFRPMKG